MQKEKYYIICKSNRCLFNVNGYCYKAHILVTENKICNDYKEKVVKK